MFGNTKSKVDKVVEELEKIGITDEGTIVKESLAMRIDHNPDGSFWMYQPHLMKQSFKSFQEWRLGMCI
eukprot:12492454-Ditylum_brightwellii.AAC.1